MESWRSLPPADHLRHFRVGMLLQQVAHLVEMVGMHHDADLVDLLTLLKGRDAVLKHGATGHKGELLGARTAEAAAGPAGKDEGDGVGHGEERAVRGGCE